MDSNTANLDQSVTNAQTTAANGLSELRTLEEALTGVNSVLTREGEELSEHDLAQLLQELDAAEIVADGVESKLDELLKNLGGMLDGLQGVGEQTSEAVSPSGQDEKALNEN
ncbi:hypothetical protein FRC08_000974 [Ceratobasidium sp. 394]|nr:hypothetical protein FRC08_000974 [Ceratobasidium sp. 394]KAG9100953.1 hypothetical protein FS749_011461 [Ceratobasidium sp. UAMH 11750]